MTVIAFRRFGGEVPRTHPRLLDAANAQVAVNTKLWNGKIRPFKRAKFEFQTVKPGPILSIYKYRGGGKEGWLHWSTDVDVVKAPLAGDDHGRIYITGDGRPKFTDSTYALDYTVAPAVAASAGASDITVATTRGFEEGDELLIGTQTVIVTSVTSSAGTLVLGIAPNLSSALTTSDVVVNKAKRLPILTWDLGVPAPSTKLTTTIISGGVTGDEGVSKGTILSISDIVLLEAGQTDTASISAVQSGSASWTLAGHQPFHNVTIDSDGYAMRLEGSCTVTVRIRDFFEVRDVEFRIVRDPSGAPIEIGSNSTHITREVMRGSEQQPGVDGNGHYWTYEVKGSAVDVPPAGEHAYQMNFSPTPGLVGDNNNAYTVVAVWKFSARYSNRIKLTLESGHGLSVGDKIELAVSRAEGTPADKEISGETTVREVDGDHIIIEAPSGGIYEVGGTWKRTYGTDETGDRAYVWTYVATFNGQNFESAPSPVSSIINVAIDGTVRLSGFVNPTSPALWNTNFTAIRLYRLNAGESSGAEYLFCDELPPTTTTYDDSKLGEDLGEVLVTSGWELPPENLSGMIELPEGGAAAFTDKEFCMAEPYYLHAWPAANRRTTHDKIVAIGAFGTSIGIATEGTPYVVTGIDPATVSMERIELVQPCLSARGAVDLGYAFPYPSPDGLVMLSIGRAEVVTQELFTADEWMALNPSSFVATRYGDRYLCFYDDGQEKGGFILDPRDPVASLVFLDIWASEAWTDPQTGRVYIVQDTIIREFDADRLELQARWRSKEMALSQPTSMGFAIVEAASYPVRFTVFADRQPLYTRQVLSRDAFRLPAGEFDSWSVEVETSSEVEGIYLAETSEDLSAYAGGQ